MVKRIYSNQTRVANQPRWLNPDEAAEYLGCSKNFLDKDRQLQVHGIPFTRLGRCVKYDRGDLDAFLESNKVASGGNK